MLRQRALKEQRTRRPNNVTSVHFWHLTPPPPPPPPPPLLPHPTPDSSPALTRLPPTHLGSLVLLQLPHFASLLHNLLVDFIRGASSPSGRRGSGARGGRCGGSGGGRRPSRRCSGLVRPWLPVPPRRCLVVGLQGEERLHLRGDLVLSGIEAQLRCACSVRACVTRLETENNWHLRQ